MISPENRIQLIAIIGSLASLLFIVELIRRRRLKEEYSLVWLFFGLILIIFSFWRDGLEYLSKFVGISYPPSTLLMLLIGGIFSILVHYSIVLSSVSENEKRIVQEIGLLRMELNMLKNLINKDNNKNVNKSHENQF